MILPFKSSDMNKAVYTAALVADGWAGAENLKNNFVTDRPTDGRMDRRTEKCPRLKTRPDTRLPHVRAGGQGLYLRSLDHLGRSSEAKDRKKTKK